MSSVKAVDPSVDEASGKDHGKRISGWLKSKAETLHAEVKEHAKEIRANTKLIQQDFSEAVQKGLHHGPKITYREERFDAYFIEKALGLELDLLKTGAFVRAVRPGGQAERLQLADRDQLVAIAGVELPVAETMEEEAFVDIVKERMSKMGRPVSLTFTRREEVEIVEEGELFIDKVKKNVEKGIAKSLVYQNPAELEELRAELLAARRLARELEAKEHEARRDAKVANDDAIAAVEEAAALRADLADLQLSKVWNAQEAKRCQEEAESTKAELAVAHASLVEAAAETERVDRARKAAEQQVEDQRAEVERLRDRAAEAEATTARLQGASSALTEQIAGLQRQLAEQQAAAADASRRAQAEAASVAERLQELEAQSAANVERALGAEAREADAREQVAQLTEQLGRLRDELPVAEATAAQAERLSQELRREVGRLRNEVQRLEARGDGGEADGLQVEAEQDAAVAYQKLATLQREVEDLRAAAASGSGPVPELLGRAQAEPRREASASCGAEFDPLADQPSTGARASGSAATVKESMRLEARIAELQEQNAGLLRQLNSRPIVFQFGPSRDDDEENIPGADGPEEEDIEDEDRQPLIIPDPASAPSKGASSRALPAPSVWSVALGGLVWFYREAVRVATQCRRQPLAKSLEKTMRSFTRKLLQRPLLLWLFYAHVAVLWILEAYEWAAILPVATDPSQQLELMVEAAELKQAAAQTTVVPATALPGGG